MNNIFRFNVNEKFFVNSILYNEHHIKNEIGSSQTSKLKLQISKINKIIAMIYYSENDKVETGMSYYHISSIFEKLNMEVIYNYIIHNPHKNVIKFLIEEVSRKTYLNKVRSELHFMPNLFRLYDKIHYFGNAINEKVYATYSYDYKEFVTANYLAEPFEDYNYAVSINLSELVKKLLGYLVEHEKEKRKKIVVQLVRKIFGNVFEDAGNMIVYMPSAKYSLKPIMKDVIFAMYFQTNLNYRDYFLFSIRSTFKVTDIVGETDTITISYDIVSTILTSPENSYLFTSVGKQYEKTIKNMKNDIKFDEKFLESYNRTINLEDYISKEELYRVAIPFPEEKYILVPFV